MSDLKARRKARKAARAARREARQARRAARKGRHRARGPLGKTYAAHQHAFHEEENRWGCCAGLLEAPKNFRSAHDTPHWSYEGDTGPEYWADMGFEAASGSNQSPIDIDKSEAQDVSLPELDIDYEDEYATIVNNGHTIQVNWPAGDVEIGDKKFDLAQFHFHSPSEHTINGKSFPLEMHFVNKSEDGTLAVIAVLFKAKGDKDNEFLAQFWDFLPDKKAEEGELPRKLGELDADDLELSEKKYYRYPGSLTTPPCSEGVVWTVMAKVEKCSKEQVEHFKECLGDFKNNRPVQPLNGRPINY